MNKYKSSLFDDLAEKYQVQRKERFWDLVHMLFCAVAFAYFFTHWIWYITK